MIVNQTAEFKKWMQKLRDFRAKVHILSRLTQVEGGNLGDFKSVGNGVLEMRIDYGPGYRLYFAKDGEAIIIPKAASTLNTVSKRGWAFSSRAL